MADRKRSMGLGDIARKYGVAIDEVRRHVEIAKRSKAPTFDDFAVVEAGVARTLRVTRLGVGPLTTAHGVFHHFALHVSDEWASYSVLVRAHLNMRLRPEFDLERPVLFRIDSGCETGQLFGDLTCECRDQLHLALERINAHGQGFVINIPRQDGRGMGLPFKLATLYLQDALRVDTVEAGALLEPDASRDIRTYAGALAVVQFLAVPPSATLHLESNNRKKEEIFRENGYSNVTRVELVVPPTSLTLRHLLAKQHELGHEGLVDESESKQ